MDILEEIVASKRQEIAEAKQTLAPTLLHKQTEALLDVPAPSLAAALCRCQTGIIAEFKRRSPSKGWIKEDGRADVIPLAYQNNGAAAASILTDYRYFAGQDSYIKEARQSGVTMPILYKNFVIDEYQLFQARLCGASAVLLIAACLSKREAADLLTTAHEIGLEVLMEMHDERETEYADLDPDLCGINNRHLGTFTTDVATSFRLATCLPPDAVKVSESGLSDPATVASLRLAGFNGFLIGETFMKTEDPGKTLRQFRQEVIERLKIKN